MTRLGTLMERLSGPIGAAGLDVQAADDGTDMGRIGRIRLRGAGSFPSLTHVGQSVCLVVPASSPAAAWGESWRWRGRGGWLPVQAWTMVRKPP